MHSQKENSCNQSSVSLGRRKVIKKMVAGAGVLAGYSVLPQEWTQPIVGKIALPAHAETSGPVTTASEYNTVEVYSLRAISGNSKRFTWLNETGAKYGSNIKFDFGECGELIVPNGAVSHGEDGNQKNYNQAFYFCGTDFRKGSSEYLDGRASVFTPPGCKVSKVTMYYNK